MLGGLGFRAWDRGVWSGGEGAAYAPWNNLEGNAADGIMRPLRAAILAANPHDTQPWLFQVKDNAITLFADRARNLGSFDPFRREMHLGLGAALENLALAAAASDFRRSIMPVDGRLTLSPDNAPKAVARICCGRCRQRAVRCSRPSRSAIPTVGPIARISLLAPKRCIALPVW